MPAIPMAVIELIAKIGIQLISWYSKSIETTEERNKKFAEFLRKLNPMAYDALKQRDDFRDLMKKIKDEENAKSNS